MNFIMRICRKIFFVLSLLSSMFLFEGIFAGDRSNNPPDHSLPPPIKSLEALLNRDCDQHGFLPVLFRESLEANWVPTKPNFFEDIGVQLAEKRFDIFCNLRDNSECSQGNSIPHIIHFIWPGSKPTPAV